MTTKPKTSCQQACHSCPFASTCKRPKPQGRVNLQILVKTTKG